MINWIILIALAGLVEGLGDIAFKEWALRDKAWLFLAGTLGYILATILWAPTLRQKDLYRILGVFFCANLIIGTAIGILIYHETLDAKSIIGLICALASILLLA